MLNREACITISLERRKCALSHIKKLLKSSKGAVTLEDIVTTSTIKDNLPFDVAVLLCSLGCFMTHRSFSEDQSMHMYKRDLYYEDGANLTATRFVENLPELLKEGWSVKAFPLYVNRDKLESKHKASSGFTLITGSYEDCLRGIVNEEGR